MPVAFEPRITQIHTDDLPSANELATKTHENPQKNTERQATDLPAGRQVTRINTDRMQ